MLRSSLILGDNNSLAVGGYLIMPFSSVFAVIREKYQKHPAVISLVMDYAKWPEGSDLEAFLRFRERRFVKAISQNYQNLAEVRSVKDQLYLYYILHRRVMQRGPDSFFKSGFNFGWLEKRVGYTLLFSMGIADDAFYPIKNPIFQTYSSQFRYSLGLKSRHALDVEIVGGLKRNNLFQLLYEWAESKDIEELTI